MQQHKQQQIQTTADYRNMAPPNLCGLWQIVKCGQPSAADCSCGKKYGIEGTTFQLSDTGDVSWKPSEGAKANPILNCDTYEIYNPSHHSAVIQFGAHIGHVIEFKMEGFEPPFDHMTLRNDLWCCLQCKRIPAEELEPLLDASFSLLPALEDGYFSDISIPAISGKQFPVHSCILSLSLPDVDWSQTNTPLSGLPEDVLCAILHYLYAECLPDNLNEKCARQIITLMSEIQSPSLSKLINMCELYLKHMSLSKEIIDLTEDIHACGNQIIEHFSGTKTSSSQGLDSLKSNPSKLCYVLKQCIRECAVGLGKYAVLCHLITARKKELTPGEQIEIIQYAKSRLPVFLKQVHQLMKAVKSNFHGMTSMQRFDIATYVVPQIESVLDIVSAIALDVKTAMEAIINDKCPNVQPLHPPHKSTHCSDDVLSTTLNAILNLKEMSKLRRFHQWMTYSLAWLLQRRENFNDMSSVNKVRSVARNLDQIMEELPVFLLRVQDVDDKLDWREFKFIFKIAASKTSGWIDVMLSHKELLQDVFDQISNLVQREEFTKSLVTLGLIDSSQNACSSQYPENTESINMFAGQAASSECGQTEGKLNLLQSVCTSPSAQKSYISKQMLPLLSSGQGCDMVFEVISTKDVESNGDQPTDTDSHNSSTEPKHEVHILKAHRVIVAARCDWFRRALLSGMRETIDRKILVHDTNPALFSVFLEYLYSGCINIKALSVDQLADLMMLSDRYEVDTLKQVCEYVLKGHVDSESVLYFLSLADQFNAKTLKEECLTFASHNPGIMDHDLFEELPQHLQSEVYDLIIWVKPSIAEPPEPSEPRVKFSSPDLSCSSSLEDLEDLMANIRTGTTQANRSISDSLEELPLAQDSSRLERCLADLYDIVGDDAPRHELAQIAMAADYDVNRAANFYFEQKKQS
ncbi:hypothetical protein FOCC_FOCC001262 [Frankliniella occidentalis]|uniref:Uncharacterized protein LOC113214650 n=1 Tax=Frankliniella occidentalis TaxID=133901 RepID=A0A6J1TAM5_FRAOC|nr:uncharacterized protein LOC113214650 [Frankliniella occidentalis]KAE8752100.1 hypothetical protein FOCC_FOCC001262 [Frankliniella occidentalis]